MLLLWTSNTIWMIMKSSSWYNYVVGLMLKLYTFHGIRKEISRLSIKYVLFKSFGFMICMSFFQNTNTEHCLFTIVFILFFLSYRHPFTISFKVRSPLGQHASFFLISWLSIPPPQIQITWLFCVVGLMNPHCWVSKFVCQSVSTCEEDPISLMI